MFLYETTIDEPGIQQKRKPLMALVETYIVTEDPSFFYDYLQISLKETRQICKKNSLAFSMYNFIFIFAENMF